MYVFPVCAGVPAFNVCKFSVNNYKVLSGQASALASALTEETGNIISTDVYSSFLGARCCAKQSESTTSFIFTQTLRTRGYNDHHLYFPDG